METLKQKKAIVKSCCSNEIGDSMIGGSEALCLTYPGDAVFCMMENDGPTCLMEPI